MYDDSDLLRVVTGVLADGGYDISEIVEERQTAYFWLPDGLRADPAEAFWEVYDDRVQLTVLIVIGGRVTSPLCSYLGDFCNEMNDALPGMKLIHAVSDDMTSDVFELQLSQLLSDPDGNLPLLLEEVVASMTRQAEAILPHLAIAVMHFLGQRIRYRVNQHSVVTSFALTVTAKTCVDLVFTYGNAYGRA